MFVKKPPVSTSIGIDIKAPEGFSVEGETNIKPKPKPPVNIHVLLDTGKTVTTSETGLEKAREKAKEYCRSGVTIVYPSSKIVHYPSHRIQEIEFEIDRSKNENF